MSEAPIQVTIIDNNQGEHCPGDCGVVWSAPAAVGFLRDRLKEKYGELLTIEYLDLAEPQTCRQNSGIVAQIKEQKLLLPLVAINGRLRLSGNVDYRMIVDAIETEKEVGDG